MPKKPEMVIYRPKAGREAELLALVLKQWPASFKAGLATSEPATVFRTTDKRSARSPSSSSSPGWTRAHQPRLIAIPS